MSLFGLSGSPSRNSVHLLVKGQRSLYKHVSVYHNIGKYRELLFLQRRNNWDGSAQRCRTQRTPFINCAMDASYGNASDDSADDEAERKKKKKIKSVGEQVKLTPGSHLGYGFERVDHVKKTTAVFKSTTGIAQPERLDASKENVTVDLKEDERFPNRKSSSAKLKTKKKIEIEHLGLLNKKVKILGEGIKATLLHHVDDLLKSIEKQLNGANELVEDLEISIKPIQKELNELQGNIKSMEGRLLLRPSLQYWVSNFRATFTEDK